MLEIYGDKSHFWQWDTNQKLIVKAGRACEVHFRSPSENVAIIVKAYQLDGQTVADVPNIILQDTRSVLAWVYICEGESCTQHEASFTVWPRQKPADYVYTETEVKTYAALEKRIDDLEKKGTSDENIAKAVEDYLKENPVEASVTINGESPDENGNFVINTLNDAEIAELTAVLT